jgi:hypothetical protein
MTLCSHDTDESIFQLWNYYDLNLNPILHDGPGVLIPSMENATFTGNADRH